MIRFLGNMVCNYRVQNPDLEILGCATTRAGELSENNVQLPGSEKKCATTRFREKISKISCLRPIPKGPPFATVQYTTNRAKVQNFPASGRMPKGGPFATVQCATTGSFLGSREFQMCNYRGQSYLTNLPMCNYRGGVSTRNSTVVAFFRD